MLNNKEALRIIGADKRSVLLPVRSPYAGLIMDGKKTIEVRKYVPDIKPDFSILICETGKNGGLGAVIGETLCTGFCGPFRNYLDLPDGHCASREFIYDYGGGVPLYGWELSSPRRFEHPKNLERFGLSRMPQKYAYVYYSSAEFEIDSKDGGTDCCPPQECFRCRHKDCIRNGVSPATKEERDFLENAIGRLGSNITGRRKKC